MTGTTKEHGQAEASFTPARRLLGQAMIRGMMLRCPACGHGRLYGRYLKVRHSCEKCGEELHHQQADDAPAYFTITLVAHTIIPLAFAVEILWHPPYWLQLLVWLPAILLFTLATLPMVKGAIIGWQWALHMHGFGGKTGEVPPTLERNEF